MIARALSLTLLHSLWQGLLVAALLSLVLAAGKRASPEARYAAACSALLALAVLPVVTFASVYRAAPLGLAGGPPPAVSVSSLCSVLWGVGAAAMLARLSLGHLHARRIVQQSAALPDVWQRVVLRLSQALGVRRLVLVGESADVAVPTVIGWLTPVVLFPLALVANLPPRAVEAILLHELSHVRRHDYLVNALQCALEALLFFHPCVHWVSRVARAEREHCCDDLAVSVTGDPISYARALTAVEALRGGSFSLGLSSTGGSLMERVTRLLSLRSGFARRPLPWPAPLVAAAVMVALATLPVVACSDAARTEAGSATLASTAPILPASVARWMPELAKAGARWGVDPDLLAAITLVESRGDPDAVSPAGSIGLMQIMPQTGAKIAEERGLAGYSDARLHDPAFNVDLGAWYVARQLRDFGTVDLAAAAYNAGPKAVRAFLDEGKPLPEEARQYETRVAEVFRELHAPSP